MTTKEAKNLISTYVDAAIPLKVPDSLEKCVEKRKLWLQKTEWQRDELKKRLGSVIDQLQKETV